MGIRRSDTRREILNVAVELLQAYGYHGFSYHHIASRLGIRSAAVHYHFPAKADLGVAVVRRFHDDFAWWREQLERRRTSGVQRLRAYFDLFRPYVAAEKVCPLGVVAVEQAGLPERMQVEARTLLDEVQGFLGEALREARETNTLEFSGDPALLAVQVQATAQGALQVARIQGRESFERAARSLWDTIGLEARVAEIA